MIKSFSSCLPGSTQTTSWTQNTTCEFQGNFVITVEGPSYYDVSSTATDYILNTQTNLPLYFQTGKTYNFNFNTTNDPVVIFDSTGLPIPYTEELNAYDITNYDLREVETNSPFQFNIAHPVAVAGGYPLTINYNKGTNFPPLPFYQVLPGNLVDIDVFGNLTNGNNLLTHLSAGEQIQVSGQFFTVVGVINNTSATVTPAPLVAINNQPLYLRGGSKILPNPGTITINVQATARFGFDAFVTRTNIRCSVPGANSRFRITYNANLRFLQDDYTTITYTIVAPPLTTSTALTGPVPINGSFDILLSQITGPDRNLNIEFRNAAGVLIHTATCLVYGNTANVTRTLTRPWDAGEIEVNQLQRSPGVPANRLRLTNGIDYLLNHLEITFLNLYHYLPPVTVGGFTYVFEVLPRRYILPYVLDPAVWDIYLFNNNTRTEVKQVLNIDYDIVGNVFHWSRTKVLPAFPAGGSFSAQPMIGQQGSAKWTPTVPGTYSYKSYIRPGTHTGTITVTTGPYTVPANKIFSLKAGLKATAKFTAPIAYRDFKVYSYSLCDYYGTFVVVTKNNYNPLILTQYRLSRWYNYHNDKPTFSFGVVKDNSIEPTVNHDYLVHYGVGLPDLKNDLIFLNHIESHINFYGGALKSLITVKSPTSMIHFERIEYTVAGVTYNEIILLGIDGKLYKLKKDLTFEQSIFVFFPVAIPTAPTLLNNDMIGEDAFGIMKWPTTKATPLSSILFPNVKHFCVSDKKIFLIASNVLRMCDYNFNILRTDIVFPEPLHSVVWSTSTVASDFLFVTTEYHKIYSVSTGPGSFTLVTIPFPTNANTVIGIPNQISYGRVLFPFSHEKKLLLVSTIGLTTIDLVSNGIHDFLPFYIRSFKNKAFITGHDTNVVLSLNVEIVGTVVTVDIQPTEFSDKATTVDVNNDAILVSHYMKFRPTLDLTNIEKIIPFTLEDKQGAATFVSSNPKKIKLLGKELISCIPGPFVSWWTNGTHRQLLRTDDYFSINYKGSGNGTFSTFVIIGDTAIDFVVTIYDSTSRMIDYFDPAQNGINAINIAGGGIQYIPPNAILGSLPLPYTLNFFGTIYNDLFTTYNGIIGFDPVYAYNARLPLSYLTTPDQDALILEPVEGWPDLPIDNSDITDIKYGTLDNNAIPGGYIDQGFIGVFAYYKFKYVGTFLNTRPNGNVRITSDIPQTGSSFNFQSITDVVVGQNVSNKLTVSPPTGIAFTNTLTSPINSVTVTAVYNHTQTAQSYYANGTTIYLDANLNPVKKYSNVSSLSGGTKYHSYVDTVSNIFLNIGNAVTHIDAVGANLIMSGIHNPTIGFEWVYDIEEENQTRFISNSTNTPAVVTSGGVSPASSIFRVQSIASSSITFNPKGNITTISNSVTVTSSAYNSVKLNQELFSSIFYLNGGSDFVANKYKIERKLVARTFPAKIKKNVQQSVHVILGKDNLPDGISIPFKITGINLTSIVLPIQVLYTTISMGSYTKLTWYDFPSLWGTETPFRAQVFKNIGDITYDAVNKTLSFNIELYGDLTLGETTEIRFGTQSITDPLHQTEFWKFSADLNYLGNTVGFIFPKAALTSIIFGGAQYNSYIPGDNDPTTGLPEIEKSDALNEYYLGFNKNIYTSFTSNVITGSYTTYQFYPGPAVQTLLGGLTPTSTIAVAATATDVTEVKTSTSLKYRAHMINTVTPIQNQLLEVNNALRTIDLTGKFIDLDYPQNLPAKTELLFKHVYPHPVHTYELAFYWGKNFQYIEYNFNDLHNPAIPKGITNKVGFKEQIIVPIVTPPGNWYSYVWASSALNGIFQSVNKPPYIFGNGVFVPYGIIGNARQPRIWQVDVNRDNILRYDLIIDSNFTPLNDMKCSIEYGLIMVNGQNYDGSTPIVENDIISFYFYFSDNNRPWTLNQNPQPKALVNTVNSYASSTVVYSIGSTQFNLSISPEVLYKTKPIRIIDIYDNKNVNVSASVTIDFDGTYHLPGNFLTATGTGAELYFILNGTTTVQGGVYVNLLLNDYIQIYNIFTSARDNDYKELIISGPEIIKLRIHTPNVYNLVSPFSLLLANQPFTQLTRPTTLVKFGPGYQFLDDTVNVEIINTQTLVATMPPGYPKILDDELPFYKTNSITLTSSAGVPGDVWLYVDTFGTGFNLNGNSTSNNSVIVNTYTDSIAVEWNIKNYYDTRAVIYQIETDLVDGSNIYLEVGEVIINQRVLLGPEVKKQPNELVRTINFSNEYLNNALMYFDSSLEFIHDQDVKTTSASLTLDKQNFTTHLNSLTTEKQNNFFAWSNALSKYAPPSIIKWQNVLGFSDLITLISSRNYTKFQQGKLDWFFTKSTRTMKFTNTSGNVRVQTFNFNTLFSPTYQKFRESDTIFFDSIGYLSPKGPKLFSIENLAKFIEYPNTFGNINTEIFTNPSTEYSAPITADSELLDFSLLKEHTTESFLPAETIFTNSTNNKFQPAAEYFLSLNKTKLRLPEERIVSLNKEQFLNSSTIFSYFTRSSFSLPANIFKWYNNSKRSGIELFTSVNSSKFLLPAESFSKLNEFKFDPAAESFTKINDSKQSPYATTFSKQNDFKYAPSPEIFKSRNDGEYNGPPLLFKSRNDSIYNENATLFNGMNKEIYNSFLKFVTSFNEQQYLPNTKPYYVTPTPFYNISNQLLYKNDSLFTMAGLLNPAFEESLQSKISILEKDVSLQTLRNVNKFIDINQQLTSPTNFSQYFINEFETHGVTPSITGGLLDQKISFKIPLPNEFETHGVTPSITGGLLDQKIGMIIPFPPEFEKHGVLPPLTGVLLDQKIRIIIPFPPEFEKHGIMPPLTGALFNQKIGMIIPFPPEFEKHGVLPPLQGQLLVQRHGLRIAVPPELEYHGIPVPLPPELEYHGIPVPFVPDLILQIGNEIPLPPEFETHGVLPPLTGEVLVQRNGVVIDFPAEFETHGVLPPLNGEVLVQRHGLRIDLPVDKEYHGIPVPLPPEIEYHGIPVPLPPEIEYHGIPVLMPSERLNNANTGKLIPMPLLRVQDNTKYHTFKQNWELYQEIEWNNDNPYIYGAFMTNFKIYVNEGKDSDYKGYPPFLSYGPNSGSALLSKNINYGLGSFPNPNAAAIVAAKYISAGVIQIVGTSHWNYRIMFDKKVFAPTRSMIFPRTWYIRGA